MDKNPLVSFIIPTYNRAKIIEETLDSIKAQTYQNWEGIIVDDGSSDETDDVMQTYCEKDSRFKYFHRAIDRQKGANACRNLGLEKATGEFIIFFDSDDLMTKDHIQVKLEPLLESDYDYSITKTKFFNVEDNRLERYYKFDEFELTAHNYIVQNINWLTYDICLKSNLAKSIRFNEKLQSGQEYNYFSKLVVKSTNAIFIPKYVTLRRVHQGSIRSQLNDEIKKMKGSFLAMWETYKELQNIIPLKTKQQLLFKCIKLCYESNGFLAPKKFIFLRALRKNFENGSTNFLLMILSKRYSNKGYFFRNKFKQQAFKN